MKVYGQTAIKYKQVLHSKRLIREEYNEKPPGTEFQEGTRLPRASEGGAGKCSIAPPRKKTLPTPTAATFDECAVSYAHWWLWFVSMSGQSKAVHNITSHVMLITGVKKLWPTTEFSLPNLEYKIASNETPS